MRATDDAGSRVLLVGDEPEVVDTLRRVAAMAGADVVPVPPPGVAAAWRSDTPMVLGAGAAAALPAHLGRRDRLLLAAGAEPDASTWRAAVRLGAEAALELPRQERALLDWLLAGPEPETSAALLCCLAGRGGAGASTLAAALALAGADRGSRALLLDLDPGGGGQELLLGVERRPGARWPDLAASRGVIDPTALGNALPTVGGLSVLSCAMRTAQTLPTEAVAAVLAAARRAFDLVVADLARGADPSAGVALAGAGVVLLVLGADVRSVSSAAHVLGSAGVAASDVRLVVRTPAPGDLRVRDVADAVGAPVAAVWPWERRLARAVDAGRFADGWRRSHVARVARQLIADVGGRSAA